jgi:hypothetical protein
LFDVNELLLASLDDLVKGITGLEEEIKIRTRTTKTEE